MTKYTQSPSNYQDGYHKQFSVDRRNIIRAVFDALINDYGASFMRQFEQANDESGEIESARVYQWKCRLLDLSDGFDDDVLIDAVDNCCKASTTHPPTLRAIQSEMQRLKFERKKAAENAELTERLREPPNIAGQQKISALLTGVGHNIRKGGQVDILEIVKKSLIYECATWNVSQNKTLPLTRRYAEKHKAATGDTREAGAIVATVAKEIGGETLTMFTQIVEWLRYEYQSHGTGYRNAA